MDTKTSNKISKIINDVKLGDTLLDLYVRWGNEKEYEDWKDYEKVMSKTLPKGVSFLKGSKRPFGMKTKVNDTEAHFYLKKKGTHVILCCKTKTMK